MNALILASAVRGAGAPIRLALIENGSLVDYRLWRPDAPDGVGDIHAGRVLARAAAIGGVFVDLGGATGFLPDSAGGKALSAGATIVTVVSRAAQGGKGPRLAMRPDANAGAKPGLLARGPGPMAGLRALRPEAPILADDFALVARFRPEFADVAFRQGCFDPIEDEVAMLEAAEMSFPNGAKATVTPTPALTAIDIDGGSATAERSGKSTAQARLNRAIIPELARQIRLRNLGGAILIDFAGMKPASRASLGPDLAAALAQDPLRPRLLGFTALGFAEVLRPRIHPPLHELLQ